MTFDQYQQAARQTAIYPNDNTISYLALALCGEAGELADKVKKVLRDHAGQFTEADYRAIALEAGDCIWYIANLAEVIGFDLSEIARMNIDKITRRKANGTLHGSGDNR